MRKDDTAKQKSMSLFSCLSTRNIHLIFWESCFEMHCVGRVQFYWHDGKAVTVIWADSRLVELLRWIYDKEEAAGGRHSWRFFYSLWSWCLKLGALWSQLKWKCIFMYICQVFYFLFFRCWGQSQCAVCYGFSWQCCNGKTKKNIYKNV